MEKERELKEILKKTQDEIVHEIRNQFQLLQFRLEQMAKQEGEL